MSDRKGLIIYFDGPDGVGKTTQLKLAAAAIRAKGRKVFETRTMGGSPIGEKLRDVMLAETDRPVETDLHIAIAAQYALSSDVLTRRSHGEVVLIDRSPLSIIGYQVYGDNLDSNLGFDSVNDLLDIYHPDLIIVYAANNAKLSTRRMNRNKIDGVDYFESKPNDYHDKVALGFKASSKKYGANQLDANGTVESIHTETMRIIDKIL